MERRSTPPSKEVRIQGGITKSWSEDYLLQAHRGSTSDLIGLMGRAELQVQYERSKAAEAIGTLLLRELSWRGYLTSSDVKHLLQLWHEEEVL